MQRELFDVGRCCGFGADLFVPHQLAADLFEAVVKPAGAGPELLDYRASRDVARQIRNARLPLRRLLGITEEPIPDQHVIVGLRPDQLGHTCRQGPRGAVLDHGRA
nr:hypothetical protein [Frankia sp. ArI3]